MTAKRLYLTNNASPYTPATKRGAWDANAATLIRWLVEHVAGAAATAAVAETNATANWDVLLGRWVSDPIPQSGTLAGTVSWVLGVLESNAAQDAVTHVHIYVTTGDSDTVRGTILTDYIGSTEWPTTAAGRAVTAQAITSLAVTAGDRLVVEIGYRSVEASATSRTGTLHYGNRGTTFLGDTDTNVTTRPGYIEFSDTNNVLRRAAPPTRSDGAYVRASSYGTVSFDDFLVPVVPGGALNGELQIAVSWCDDALDLPDPPAGTTWLTQGAANTLTAVGKSQVYYRYATGSEADEIWTGGTGSNLLFVASIAGAHPSTPFDVVPTWGGSATTATAHVAPTIDPTDTNTLLICSFYALSNNDGQDTHSTPAGMTELQDAGDELVPYISGSICSENLTSGAATGTRTSNADQSSPWMAVSFAIKSAPTGTTAPAGVASGTGAAQAPTAAVAPQAGVASGTGAALAPSTRVALTAGAAAGTGTAQAPTAQVSAPAGTASGTGAAQAPSVRVTALAGVAAGTGSALDPTISTSSTAAAGVAAGTGAALDPSISTSQPAPAGVAAGTGAAQAPTVAVAALAGAAAGAGAANAPTVAVTAPAGAAAGTGAALDPVAAVSALPSVAAGTGAALDPTVSTSQPAPAGVASGTGEAQPPVAQVIPETGAAAGSGAALAPSVAITVRAGVAAGTGTAHGATTSTSTDTTAPAGVAAGVGAALDPTVTTDETASPGAAAGVGEALAPTVAVTAPAGAAAGTGAAAAPTAAVAPELAAATGTGAALAPSVTVTALAGAASGTGTAHDPSVSTVGQDTAQPGTAAGVGAALDPTVIVTALPPAAAGAGAASSPAVAVTVDAGTAAGVGEAQSPAPAVTAQPDAAAGTGEALNAAAIVAGIASAGVAAGTGAALNPTIRIDVRPPAAAGLGRAQPPTIQSAGTSPGSGSSGWYQLLAIEQHRELVLDDTATVCPNDGTPYVTDAAGLRCCPFDGYRPDGWAEPVSAGASWGGYTAPPRERGDYVPIDDYLPGWGP